MYRIKQSIIFMKKNSLKMNHFQFKTKLTIKCDICKKSHKDL